MLIKRECNFCQKLYEADTRYLKRNQGLCCSKECGIKYSVQNRQLNNPIELNVSCSSCGKKFHRSKSKLKSSKSGLYFCSKECQDAGYRDPKLPVSPGPNRSNPPHEGMGWMKGRGWVTLCLSCDNPTKSRSGRCLNCEKNYKISEWLNGNLEITRSGKTQEPQGWVKAYLIELRGDKCEFCGWKEPKPDGTSIIQMDHIDGNYLNNSLENLRLLCPNHHAMTETYGSKNRGKGKRSYRIGTTPRKKQI